MPDKYGATVASRIGAILELYGVVADDISHVCTDGGSEATGGERTTGFGSSGFVSMLFNNSVWTWCLKHLLQLCFHDIELSSLYDELDQVSKFLRVGNYWDKVRAHLNVLLDASHDQVDAAYGKARERLLNLGLELEALQKKMPSTIIPLGAKTRWLTEIGVAQYVCSIADMLAEAIVLAFSKDPNQPQGLDNAKTKKAHRAYSILTSPEKQYMFAILTVLGGNFFSTMYDEVGARHHTLLGSFNGQWREKVAALRRSVTGDQPDPEFWALPLDVATRTGTLDACKAKIVETVTAACTIIEQRLVRMDRTVYLTAAATVEEYVPLPQQQCFIAVPTQTAIQAAGKLLEEWGRLSDRERSSLGKHMKALLSDESDNMLRQQLKDFSQGHINPVTLKPQPLRHYKELCQYMVAYFEFMLTSSSDVESFFSTLSNLVRANKAKSSTQTLSVLGRSMRNREEMMFLSQVPFTDIDPKWQKGALPPRWDPAAAEKRCKLVITSQQYKAMLPRAKALLETCNGNWYKADYLGAWQRIRSVAPACGKRASRRRIAQPQEKQPRQLGQTAPRKVPASREQNSDESESSSEDGDNMIQPSQATPSQGSPLPEHRRLSSPTAYEHLPINMIDEARTYMVGQVKVEVWGPCNGPTDVIVQYHKLEADEAQEVKFFSSLAVTDDAGVRFTFSTASPEQAALLHYDNNSAGDKVLAYVDIVLMYELPNSQVWVEHGYLYDRDDVAALKPAGHSFAKKHGPVQVNELLDTVGTFHSPAYLIEGQVMIFKSPAAAADHGADAFFCCRAWDADTGDLVADPVVEVARPRWRVLG